jgi:hypothetical protein
MFHVYSDIHSHITKTLYNVSCHVTAAFVTRALSVTYIQQSICSHHMMEFI